MSTEQLDPALFIAKWQQSTLKERSSAQEHFLDLCRLLGEPTPAEADPNGIWYCFEKGLKKAGGGGGWADVWKRGCFAWEYKGKGKDLHAAFKQLQLYTPALEYPPLLIVSDIDSIVIHTAFTGTVPDIYIIPLTEFNDPKQLQILKWAFTEPERLKPGQTTQQLTEAAATEFADLAQKLRDRGHPPQQVAHFLNKLLFCLFAEHANLLPSKLFIRLLDNGVKSPQHAQAMLSGLFNTMTEGGIFGVDTISWFNGGLFDSLDTLPLELTELKTLAKLAKFDWSAIDPSIFGTLFERGLDPDKRSQLGAHFTDPNSIMRLVKPVIVEPLLAEWKLVTTEISTILTKSSQIKGKVAVNKLRNEAELLLQGFLLKLSQFRILDPACGSGNFLFLSLKALKDLEQQVILDAELMGLTRSFPQVGPEAVTGIEINPYAAELARVTVWIGEIQWMLQNGYNLNRAPILRPLNTIEQRDAVLNPDNSEPDWPQVDVIIGNPPFLGDKKLLAELGEEYVAQLRHVYKGRVPNGADLVTYWFERARTQIDQGKAKRAGLVATNSIRGGANRKVLERILTLPNANTTEPLKIFNAWSDEPWVNDSAAVRVSLICFGKTETQPVLNDQAVTAIYADLTARPLNSAFGNDLAQAKPLVTNIGIAFIGTQKSGSFDIPGSLARQWLISPNPHKKSNSDVLRPWINGMDIVRRPSDTWIIDFGLGLNETDAALYELPFQHVISNVKYAIEHKISNWQSEHRNTKHLKRQQHAWWQHWCPRPDMRTAMVGLSRFIATPRVSKHRLFVWLPTAVLPDSRIYAVARADDTIFGILHSRIHEIWSLATCSWHGVGNDPTYNAASCFETFPFPDDVLLTPDPDSKFPAIAQAAQQLNELRENWLNPSEWVEKVPEIVPGYPDRVIPKPGHETELKKRTLTNLYNQRPSWLINVHKQLDNTVAAAYDWPADLTDAEILRRLLDLNLQKFTQR